MATHKNTLKMVQISTETPTMDQKINLLMLMMVIAINLQGCAIAYTATMSLAITTAGVVWKIRNIVRKNAAVMYLRTIKLQNAVMYQNTSAKLVAVMYLKLIM